MIQTKARFRTLKEYAALDPSELPEGNYELVDGAIVEMGAESLQNVVIASFLFAMLLQQSCPPYLLHRGTEIAVSSAEVTSRYPDLMVLTEATFAAMSLNQRSLVTPEMPSPALVVEVVSPGEPGSSNYQRDYVEKPREYAKCGIPEFWRIDPARALVSVLVLEGKEYTERVFRGSDRIASPTFPALVLSADEILRAGQ